MTIHYIIKDYLSTLLIFNIVRQMLNYFFAINYNFSLNYYFI